LTGWSFARAGPRCRGHTRHQLRAQGPQLVQIWIPNVTAEGFAAKEHRQSRLVAAGEHAEADHAFADAVRMARERDGPRSGPSPAALPTRANRGRSGLPTPPLFAGNSPTTLGLSPTACRRTYGHGDTDHRG
jgi:hypothetical protein